jgi:SAM-dependent methyltransferase
MTNLIAKVRAKLWRLSMTGLPRGPHITRYAMYQRLAELGAALPDRTGRVLSISHSTRLGELLGLQPTETVEANYPDCDMTSLGFPDCSYDFVLSDQVLEHVEGDPGRAVDESWRVLRPGGIAVHTTCFINPIHGSPGDFWRFTPAALRLLCRRFTEVIDCGGWGNFEAWHLIRDGLRWEGIPHARWHPLHRLATRNDPIWPIVTWVVAKK